MSGPTSPVLLAPSVLALIRGGVSAHLASRDGELVPSVTRVWGTKVLPDGRVRVFVVRGHAEAVLRDVESSSVVAAVFSDVVSCRSVQIKGIDARVVPLEAGEDEEILAGRDAFFSELAKVDHPLPLAMAMWAEGHAAVEFTPSEVYDQTPGPRAGERVAG